MRQLSLDSELARLMAKKARQQERVFDGCKDNAIKVCSTTVVDRTVALVTDTRVFSQVY